MNGTNNYETLKKMVVEEGECALFGVGDVRSLREIAHFNDPDITQKLPHGISIGFHLSDAIIDNIVDAPDNLYKHHYREVNWYLDRVALRAAAWIQNRGYDALPVPASIVVDWRRGLGHLSHKAVGRLAGHGWIGRNILLVNPLYGCRIRYVSVLTNLPLKVDSPMDGDCGSCRECIAACPASAIGGSREEFDLPACAEQCRLFSRTIGVRICGLCIKACSGKSRPREEKQEGRIDEQNRTS